jgi:tetratricopeptide (TPR) repeat protein
MQGMTAFAHFFAGRYDEACTWAEKAFWQKPDILGTLRVAAVSYAFAGRFAEARKAVARALELDPQICLSNLKDRIGVFRRPQDYAKYAKACAWRDYLNSGEHLIRIRYISFIAERRG